MPTVKRNILGRGQTILSSNFLPALFVAQPSPLLTLKLPQLTHYSIHIRSPIDYGFAIFSKEQIRKLQRVFDESHVLVDLPDRSRRVPGSFLMTPIIRVDQGRAVPLVEAGTVDRTAFLLEQAITDSMQRPGSLAQCGLHDHHCAVRRQQRQRRRNQTSPCIDRLGELVKAIGKDDDIVWAGLLNLPSKWTTQCTFEIRFP